MKRELISNGNPMEDIVGFSRAVRVGPYISVGGTAPVDENGKTVGVGDPAVQTRRCIEIIKEALERAGEYKNFKHYSYQKAVIGLTSFCFFLLARYATTAEKFTEFPNHY